MRDQVIAGHLQLSIVDLIDKSKDDDPTAPFFDVERHLDDLPLPEVLVSLDHGVASSILPIKLQLSLTWIGEAVLVVITHHHLPVFHIDRFLLRK